VLKNANLKLKLFKLNNMDVTLKEAIIVLEAVKEFFEGEVPDLVKENPWLIPAWRRDKTRQLREASQSILNKK